MMLLINIEDKEWSIKEITLEKLRLHYADEIQTNEIIAFHIQGETIRRINIDNTDGEWNSF